MTVRKQDRDIIAAAGYWLVGFLTESGGGRPRRVWCVLECVTKRWPWKWFISKTKSDALAKALAFCRKQAKKESR